MVNISDNSKKQKYEKEYKEMVKQFTEKGKNHFMSIQKEKQ